MATRLVKQDNNETHCICSGYIRLNCEEFNNKRDVSLIFPTAIILIIIDYFINPFEWDSQKCDDHLIVSDDKLTVRNDAWINGAILAKNILSSDAVKHVKWEMTLTTSGKIPCFAMGYVQHGQRESVKFGQQPVWIGDKQGQCALYLDDDEDLFHRINNGDTIKYDKKWNPQKVVQGDKFEIQFDFIKKQSSCYWNGNFIGILDDKLSDKIYPAMSIWGNHGFECTKWELFYIKH